MIVWVVVPVCVDWVVARFPVTVVRIFSSPPLTVPFSSNDCGASSGPYLNSTRLMVRFAGSPRRPSLVTVRPVASDLTVTSSRPIGFPRINVVYAVAPDAPC